MEGDREQCLAAGMDDYLAKPFTQKQLSEVLGRWLQKKPATREARAETGDEDMENRSGSETERVSIDRKALDTIRALQRQGKPDLLTRVINIYLEDSLRLLDALRHALSEEDGAGVKRQAHSLKSSSANVGALRLAELCKELEAAGEGESTDRILEKISRVEEEYASVRRELTAELEGIAA
jgi:HPt (histidine-containing phosphotransfer) domain-containing protein